MISTVLVLAVIAGGEAADFGKRGNGCDGGRGGLFGGGLFKKRGHGNACGGGCYGGNGACNGSCYGGSGGCYGSVVTGGCAATVPAPACGGVVAMPAPGYGVPYGGCGGGAPAPGCGGVIHHGGVVTMPAPACGGVIHHGGVVHHGCGGVIHHGGAPMIHGGCTGGKVIINGGGKVIEPEKKVVPEKKIEGDTAVKPGELTATEAKWLKEMMDAEKDPAKKKEIEKEFLDEKDAAGRAAIYKLFKKDSGKDDN